MAKWDLAQPEVAKRLGITRTCLNELLRGKSNKFSHDALTTLAIATALTRWSIRTR